MASCDWQKIKTPQEAKAMLRHCVTDERMKTEHANTEIDKNRTQQNVAFGFMSDYVESCTRYDERLAELDAVEGANKRKDRVTLVGLSIPTPEGMSDTVARQWFADVYAHIEERFGSENVLGGTAHFDEVHEYKDAETGARRESRAHLHAYVIPVHGEKLNAKQVMSKANMIALNREVEEITRERYPEYRFMTGTKRKSKKSVETLKNESAEREAEARAQQIVADAQRDAERIRADAQRDAGGVLSDANDEARQITAKARKASQIERESLTRQRAELAKEREALDAREADIVKRESEIMNAPIRATKRVIETVQRTKDYKPGTPDGNALGRFKMFVDHWGDHITKQIQRDNAERMRRVASYDAPRVQNSKGYEKE